MTQRPEAGSPDFAEIVADHFRMRRDYDNFRARGTDSYLLIATLSGSGRYSVPFSRLSTRVGDVTLYAPHALHDYGTDADAGEWELLWAHFRPRPHWHEWLRWPPIDHRPHRARGLSLLRLLSDEADDAARNAWPDVLRALEKMVEYAGEPHREAWAMHALEEVLLLLDEVNPSRPHLALDTRVVAAMTVMRRDLEREMTLASLSREVGLSPSRLSALFKAQVGQSPLAYREAQRLNRAAQFLRLSSLNVEEVAREVGFPDPFYFSNRFKRAFGVSPRAYRAGQPK